MQLFVFHDSDRAFSYARNRLVILAETEDKARQRLELFLINHPNMRNYTHWTLEQICGKLDDGIFAVI
jgi:hypothetical protein